MDQYKAALDANTALVSVMWANSETGTIFPIAEIAALAKEHGALFHTDAVQVIGKMPVNVQETKIDMLSLSGHKFHAPKGVGALYVKRGTRFTEFMMGGHQEKGRRGGTENIPYIVGLGVAAELAQKRVPEIEEPISKTEEMALEGCTDLEILSAREKEVLIRMLEDKKRKEIAYELCITENTVKKHISSIFAKLDVANRNELFAKITHK